MLRFNCWQLLRIVHIYPQQFNLLGMVISQEKRCLRTIFSPFPFRLCELGLAFPIIVEKYALIKDILFWCLKCRQRILRSCLMMRLQSPRLILLQFPKIICCYASLGKQFGYVSLPDSTKKKIRLLIAFHLIIDFPNPPTAACLLYFPEYLPSCALESLFLFGSNRDQCFTFEWIDMGFNWNLFYGFGQNTLGEVRWYLFKQDGAKCSEVKSYGSKIVKMFK